MTNIIKTRWLPTPLGPLEIAIQYSVDKWTYRYLEFKAEEALTDPTNQDSNNLLDLAEKQLLEYFQGSRKGFEELYQHLSDQGTEFQKQAWSALTKVAYGETWSYGQQAQFLNNPNAVRAIGAANGKNPLAIVVPCHRIIGANGSLTGYAGGLDKKKWLLEFESNH